MIKSEHFTYRTRCKGMKFGNYKITNNSNYIVFYKGEFVGEVGSKKDADKFVENLVKFQKLTFTPIYR